MRFEVWQGDLFVGYCDPSEAECWREAGYRVIGDVR